MENNKQYVLMHNFGYGSEPEKKELNKLLLRNIFDLKTYVYDLMSIAFFANVEKNVLTFVGSKQKIIVDIKLL